ncbi:medium-chain acyl-[acyl-carrier-protein] hydrolase [Saccharomonospora amisosensis]|uniref:Medium-chain acyl-[acyl-carrier-protein] hydrolase n=1 Tax=Saccharomonospora amisosensis TaxID=1128677 RepID=A0A7X5UPN0_9PSEU|nr:alpha/beta fold hydrolase [Saccharomonospora amisosensis]NIJ11886.1 medium-chain acyl-[acyl-carrier-protein] hydrolase [Saccharomonospora amisosensis]
MSAAELTERTWLRHERTGAAVNLLCLPHAGAGASSFTRWLSLFPASVAPVRVQLPGREDAVAEPPLRSAGDVVAALLPRLAPLTGTRLALYGHSMGAVVAFELARALYARGVVVDRLFVSGRRAPHLPARGAPIHRASDEELTSALTTAGADLTFAGPAFLRYALRLVRADLALSDEYQCRDEAVLHCPITVFHGIDDPIVALEEAHAWNRHTDAGCTVHTFSGDHFFHQHHRAAIAALIAGELA